MSTRRERLEAKAEKRRDWAQSRERRASQDFAKADLSEAASGIPFGQPILVGHHSERGHRNAIDRADKAMGRAVESSNMADHHRAKADGIENQLDRTIFSDDPDAAERINEKIAALEAKCERIKSLNKQIRKAVKAGLPEGWLESLDVTAEERYQLECNKKFTNSYSFQPYTTQNARAEIRRLKQRLADIERQANRKAEAEDAGGLSIKEFGEYCTVTFAEKPAREVLNALKAAGFRWGGGCWTGRKENLPEEVA